MNLRKQLRDFLFMATVLERFNELGLTHTNKILSFVGERVSQAFIEENPGLRPERKQQTDGDLTYSVNDYPPHWQERMDYVIILACTEEYKKSSDGATN